MNWRPWLIVALLLGVFVVNSALMFFEEVAGPEEVAEAKDEVKDKLAAITFTAATRRGNFAAFGLPDDLVEAASDQAKRVESRKERLVELLKEHADVLLQRLGCNPIYRDYVGVLLNNEMWREQLASVPFERRLLLLPKCLRVESKCPAPFDELRGGNPAPRVARQNSRENLMARRRSPAGFRLSPE